MTGVKYPDIRVPLSETDGNAMMIIGRISTYLRRAGINPDEFVAEATNADSYDAMLSVCMRWVNVS